MLTNLQRRKLVSKATHFLLKLATFSCIFVLFILLFQVSKDGLAWLDWQFLTSFPSRFPAKAGIKSALYGSIWVISLTTLISLPLGVGTSVYLEEFARKSWFTKIIKINIANLAGVPSIVYGMLGLVVFVRWFSLDRSVLAGALTLSLLILPTIVLASSEALRAIPDSIRQGAFALGATKWQTVRDHIVPAAMPGILTGLILAVSRAIGETAPLLMIGALTYVAFVPEHALDGFTALPIQIFNWASRPQQDFHSLAAAGIIVLLTILITMNSLAIYLRYRFQRRIKW